MAQTLALYMVWGVIKKRASFGEDLDSGDLVLQLKKPAEKRFVFLLGPFPRVLLFFLLPTNMPHFIITLPPWLDLLCMLWTSFWRQCLRPYLLCRSKEWIPQTKGPTLIENRRSASVVSQWSHHWHVILYECSIPPENWDKIETLALRVMIELPPRILSPFDPLVPLTAIPRLPFYQFHHATNPLVHTPSKSTTTLPLFQQMSTPQKNLSATAFIPHFPSKTGCAACEYQCLFANVQDWSICAFNCGNLA